MIDDKMNIANWLAVNTYQAIIKTSGEQSI